VSGIDHEANIAPWVDLAQRQSLILTWWKPASSSNPKLLAEDLKGLISDKTRLVTCTHASNILGSIHDIKAIAEVVHQTPRGMLCVDGVAYAPHRPLDVKGLDVDFYAFSWYKVFGPHISMLYASRRAQEQMKSLGHFFNPHTTLENKIGLAGSSYELAQAIPSVLEYLGPSGSGMWKAIAEQEYQLQRALLSYLSNREDVTVFGETNADSRFRVPTVSFKVDGWTSKELVEAVEKDTKFGFRWGSFYSDRLVREVLGLGVDGVVRVSMVHYNTGEFGFPNRI
jgi:selenocysteine lyase/cysteine desulfurase